MLPRSMQNLPAVDLILFQDASDIGVFVVEHLVQEKDSALEWSQPLQKHQECRGKSIVHLRNETTFKDLGRDHRLGQPLAEISFALHPRRLQMIDTETAGNGDQIRSRRMNLLFRRLLQADVGLLEYVFGISSAPQHSIGNRKQKLAVAAKHFQPVRWSITRFFRLWR